MPDSCIEIMTGAMLPAGCDAVVPVEQVQRNGEIAEIGRKPRAALAERASARLRLPRRARCC